MKKVTNTLCRIAMAFTAAFLLFSFLKTNAHAANDTIVIDFSQGQSYNVTYEEYQKYLSSSYRSKREDIRKASPTVKNAVFSMYWMEAIGDTYFSLRNSKNAVYTLLNENPLQALYLTSDFLAFSSSVRDPQPTDNYYIINSGASTGTYEATLTYKYANEEKHISKSDIMEIFEAAYELYGIDAVDANHEPYVKVKFIFKSPNSSLTTLNADGSVTNFIPDKEFSENGNSYKVTADNEVCFTGVTNKKAKSVNIPDSVVHQNIVYSVTSVADKALYKNKKVKSITVGQNVKTIGRSSFAACSNLSKVKINCSSLTALGKKAISGASKDLVVKVPKAQYKRFKKAFKKAGMSTVKIKRSK